MDKKAYRKEYDKINKEKIREQKKLYYAQNKERIKAREAAYRVNHRDLMIKKSKAYRDKNRDEINLAYRQKYRDNHEFFMLKAARKRAGKDKLPFDLELSDIVIPEFCPVLGIKLEIGRENKDSSPSLDKIIPEKGYVKGNIAVISLRANRLKSDGNLSEFKNIINYLEKHENAKDKTQLGEHEASNSSS